LPPRRAAPPCGVPGVQHLVHEGLAVPLQRWPAASAADRQQRQHNKMSPPEPAMGTTTRQQPTDLALRVTEHTQQLQRRGSPVQRAAARVHAASHCSHVTEACPSSRVPPAGFRIKAARLFRLQESVKKSAGAPVPQALRGYGSEAAGYLQRHSLRSFCTEVPVRERGWQPEQPCFEQWLRCLHHPHVPGAGHRRTALLEITLLHSSNGGTGGSSLRYAGLPRTANMRISCTLCA